MSINERFFFLLGENGTSQKGFSDNTGISTQTISAWKKRKTDPPSSLISTIADFFGVTTGYLLTGEEPKYLPDGINKNPENSTFSQQQLLSYFNDLSDMEKDIIIGKAAELYKERYGNEKK